MSLIPVGGRADPGLALCRAAAHTDPGRKRTQNQDNFLIVRLTRGDGDIVLRPDAGADDGRAAIDLKLDGAGALLLVADGMGGAAAGRLASGLACSFILAELQARWSDLSAAHCTPTQFLEYLRDSMSAANRQIHDHALRNPECTGMGTTATAVGILDASLCIAQVGDSRAYLVRDGRTRQLTHDQSFVQKLMDIGLITPEQAAHSEQSNLILQALGIEQTVNVDATLHELQPGDVIVVCSDGLYRVVQDDDIAAAVSRGSDPAATAESLVALANERGGPDNVTVIVARFGGGPGSSIPSFTGGASAPTADLER